MSWSGSRFSSGSALGRPIMGVRGSLIGVWMSISAETDVLVGVTVLFGVGSWSPHYGCQGFSNRRLDVNLCRNGCPGRGHGSLRGRLLVAPLWVSGVL